MPKAEGGCGPDSPAWLYLAKRGRPPLSLRDISPRFAGGEEIRIPLTTQCGQRGESKSGRVGFFSTLPTLHDVDGARRA